MIEGRKPRINPFNDSFDLNEIQENLEVINLNTDYSSFVLDNNLVQTENSSTLSKSKKKRLRIKRARLRYTELREGKDKTEPVLAADEVSDAGTLVITVPSNNITSQENTLNETVEKINSTKSQQQKHNKSENKLPVNMDQEKSREDVMAERQMKKLAKQNAKKVNKNDKDNKVNANVKSEHNQKCNTPENLEKVAAVEPKSIKKNQNSPNLKNENQVKSENKKITDNIKSNVKVDSLNKGGDVVDGVIKKVSDVVDGEIRKTGDVVDGEIRIRTKPPVLNDFNETKLDKSRSDVMAEREAKKIAKLAKKQQVKDSQPVDVKENIPLVNKPEQVSDKKSDQSGEKSKAELRAERRAKQEAQRAAKESQKKVVEQPPPVVEKKVVKKSLEIIKDVKAEEKVSEFKAHQHKLFSHLYVEVQPLNLNSVVHPAIVELGKKYASRVVNGSNARCVALLHTLKQVITDYRVSSTSDLNRGLEAELAAAGSYLSRSRPLSVSMTNSLRYLRSHLTQTSPLPEDEAKRRLLEAIDTFIREQVDVAGQAISNTVQEKISNGDVILTYGCSSLVWRCLKESYQAGKEFSVVVVDGGPWFEGRELLRRLAALSIPCTYLLISAIGFAITKISKVLLGAHALLANGYVMSRTGSAMVALTASAHSVPVLVCCETYKFCERVQADAFVHNELGGSDELPAKGVKHLSPVYDITPPDLVTAVVTELAILPCTSVPVVLRVKPSDTHHTA